MNINKEKLNYITGAQNKEWNVEKLEQDEYIVFDWETDEIDHNTVDTNSWDCDGTYYQYNPSCPHIDAVDTYRWLSGTDIEHKNKVVDDMIVHQDDIDDIVGIHQESRELYILRVGLIHGYVQAKIYVDGNYVVFDVPTREKITDRLDVYDTFETDMVYRKDDFSEYHLQKYVKYHTDVDNININEVVEKISANLSENL